MMIKKLGLMVMPFLFLIIRIPSITFMFIPIINTFSLMNGNQNSNNTNQSQLSVTTSITLLKQLDLFTLSQRLNNTISDLMAVADASMNGSNYFGNIPLVNVTSGMKLKYHGIPSDQDLEMRNEAKNLLATNKALLYVGLLLPIGDRYFGELYLPYQTNSSTTNFAYRDHFIGAVKTNHPYLSDVIYAVSTGELLSILANPIYSNVKNKDSLIGVQVLGLNFTYFDELINQQCNQRIVIRGL